MRQLSAVWPLVWQRLHHIDLYVGHSLCQWRSPQYLQGAGPRLSLSRFRFLLLSFLELDRDRGLLLLPCMVRFGLMCCDCLFTFCWLNPGQYRDMPGSLPPEVQGMLNSGLSSGFPGLVQSGVYLVLSGYFFIQAVYHAGFSSRRVISPVLVSISLFFFGGEHQVIL